MRFVTYEKAVTAILLVFGTTGVCETVFAETHPNGKTVEPVYVETDSPMVAGKNPHGVTDIDCQVCHTTANWEMQTVDLEFQHNRDTDFSLEGHHLLTDCRSCHAGMVFQIQRRECIDCHGDVHQSELGFDCAECHDSETWEAPSFYNQHALTRFVLVGRHATTDCQSCHLNQQEGEFAGLSTDCMECHIDAYLAASEPAHTANSISTTCDQCHTSDGWPTSTIEDHAQFGFVLDGGHRSIENDCLECHVDHTYSTTSSECSACHLEAYEISVDPNHLAGQFPMECEECHTTDPGWAPATFDHTLSTFPLTGAHLTVESDCISCHPSGYTGTDSDCYACHQTEFETAADPNHIENQFALQCELCHSTAPGWAPAAFDHSGTGFQMTGAHLTVENQCEACHSDGFANTPSDCYACHQTEFETAADPNHIENQFALQCELCHSTAPGWAPAAFDHSATGFPMNGAHLNVENQCNACHADGFTNTPAECFACHETEYTAATNPDHAANGFPTACEICHSTAAGWTPAFFDHSQTAFPLTGAHLTIESQCLLCHAGGFTNTPTDCYACHEQAYVGAANPDHSGLEFPVMCEACHNTTAWVPSTFDHTSYAGYQLLGAHVAIANECAQCHTGNLISASTDCFDCHMDDYNTAANPNHAANGFPTDCESCHTQIDWIPSTFDHDAQYFPIYSGRHLNEWIGCGGGSGDGAGCHTTPNITDFSCIHCHDHNQVDMDLDHSEVGGYVYNSQACFACHPDGLNLFRGFQLRD